MAQATCAHCGAAFVPVNRVHIYCRPQCRWSAKARFQESRNRAVESRRCSRCQTVKPSSDFNPTSTYCRPCGNDVQREWRTANPERRREYKRRSDARAVARDPDLVRKATLRKFGLTLESFAALLEKQGGRCAICETDNPAGRHGNWHVDHDRRCCPRTASCGRCVRGLLCQNCNLMIGHAKDRPAALRAAAAYLESHSRS